MDIKNEKLQIIEELRHRDEEWLIIAIKKLLDLDNNENEFSSEHKDIIAKRLDAYGSNPNNVITLNNLKEDLKTEGKL
jgi:hypothetical protein